MSRNSVPGFPGETVYNACTGPLVYGSIINTGDVPLQHSFFPAICSFCELQFCGMQWGSSPTWLFLWRYSNNNHVIMHLTACGPWSPCGFGAASPPEDDACAGHCAMYGYEQLAGIHRQGRYEVNRTMTNCLLGSLR
jgi:hypothetical protein